MVMIRELREHEFDAAIEELESSGVRFPYGIHPGLGALRNSGVITNLLFTGEDGIITEEKWNQYEFNPPGYLQAPSPG